MRAMPTDRSSGELARLIRTALRAESPNAAPGATARRALVDELTDATAGGGR